METQILTYIAQQCSTGRLVTSIGDKVLSSPNQCLHLGQVSTLKKVHMDWRVVEQVRAAVLSKFF